VKKLHIALERQYASPENLARIEQIASGSNVSIFAIHDKYPLIKKIRGLFRRVIPFDYYLKLARKLDPLAEAQKLDLPEKLSSSSESTSILLFPPGLEPSAANQLVTLYNPVWVHSITTGIERVPQLSSGAIVTNSRGVHSRRIAEFTLGLILAMGKNIPQHATQTKKRIWGSIPSEEIEGSRVGIVGLGSIGIEIAKICKAIGMEVWATKRELIESECVDRLLPADGLSLLLSESDYVVLAVPLTKSTRHLINREKIALMKPNACLINISRGSLIDEDALYEALKNLRIRGAGLDIFEDEKPLPRNSRFYQLPNLLTTSYSAYYSKDSSAQLLELFFKNLQRFASDEPLTNIAREY